jgi:hypothetical protein
MIGLLCFALAVLTSPFKSRLVDPSEIPKLLRARQVSRMVKVFGAGEGARTLDPDLGKVVPPRCAMLRAFADLPQIPVITRILRCWFLLLFAPICANLLAIC